MKMGLIGTEYVFRNNLGVIEEIETDAKGDHQL